MEHVTTDIVKVWSLYRTRTAHDDIIGRVDTIAAGAMSTQEVIPTITVHQGTGLAVDGHILLNITLHTLTRLWVELDEPDITKIGAIGSPQTTCCGV